MPKKALECPSLEISRSHLNMTLNRSDKNYPCFEREVGLNDLQSSLQTELSCDFIILWFYFSVMFDLQNKQISGTIDPCDTFTKELYFHNYHSVLKVVTRSYVLIGIFYLHHLVYTTDTTDSALKETISGLLQAFWHTTMPTKRQTPHNLSARLDLIPTAFREKPGS